jgi:hypothetical protein
MREAHRDIHANAKLANVLVGHARAAVATADTRSQPVQQVRSVNRPRRGQRLSWPTDRPRENDNAAGFIKLFAQP